MNFLSLPHPLPCSGLQAEGISSAPVQGQLGTELKAINEGGGSLPPFANFPRTAANCGRHVELLLLAIVRCFFMCVRLFQ